MNIPLEVLHYVFGLHGCEVVEALPHSNIMFNNPAGAQRYMLLGLTFCALKDPERPGVTLHQETDQPSSFHALVRCLGDQYEVVKSS